MVKPRVCLTIPHVGLIKSYQSALKKGWKIHEGIADEDIIEEMEFIKKNPELFIEIITSSKTKQNYIELNNNDKIPAIPNFRFWIDDGEYCGEISLRWQNNSPELPDSCLGHLAWAVVPWKRGDGYAKKAVEKLLPIVKKLGLPWLDIAMTHDNIASWKTAENLGAIRICTFQINCNQIITEAYKYRLAL